MRPWRVFVCSPTRALDEKKLGIIPTGFLCVQEGPDTDEVVAIQPLNSNGASGWVAPSTSTWP